MKEKISENEMKVEKDVGDASNKNSKVYFKKERNNST